MNKKTLKTYVLIVSETFPHTHKKAGKPTGFPLAIKHGDKIHTLRGNYPFWEKRIKGVQEGRAVLSVRVWTGRPYMSKQEELFRFTKDDGVGVQKCICSRIFGHARVYTSEINIDNPSFPAIFSNAYEYFSFEKLAGNDGLSKKDFLDWFDGTLKVDMDPLAIIHFTKFRY